MRIPLKPVLLLMVMLLPGACVSEFIPQIEEEEELLVVEGIITDQPGVNTIRLSKSMPLGKRSEAIPLGGCTVSVSDDLGNTHQFGETETGIYCSDSATFKGETGRFYTLHITAGQGSNTLNYESFPAEIEPVPVIDSVYYEKTVIKEDYEDFFGIDGCQIYLDTRDPENNCKFYRWDFSETWMLRLNFSVTNQICWLYDKSISIDIKSTAAYAESMIKLHPVTFISNTTDRLTTKYSILVNQYSMNEDEYSYWESLQNLTVQSGGLYDIIPSSIPSNLRCIEHPDEKVLGYFSVSGKTSKRIFIKDDFRGIIDPYADCVTDTVYTAQFPGLNIDKWILLTHGCSFPCLTFYEITTYRECADCTTRGTTQRPAFWEDEE